MSVANMQTQALYVIYIKQILPLNISKNSIQRAKAQKAACQQGKKRK